MISPMNKERAIVTCSIAKARTSFPRWNDWRSVGTCWTIVYRMWPIWYVILPFGMIREDLTEMGYFRCIQVWTLEIAELWSASPMWLRFFCLRPSLRYAVSPFFFTSTRVLIKKDSYLGCFWDEYHRAESRNLWHTRSLHCNNYTPHCSDYVGDYCIPELVYGTSRWKSFLGEATMADLSFKDPILQVQGTWDSTHLTKRLQWQLGEGALEKAALFIGDIVK